jgi:hypothetical protein
MEVTNDSTWSLTNGSIASLTGPGGAIGVKAGTTGVDANYSGLFGSAILNVTDVRDFSCVVSPDSVSTPRLSEKQGTVTCTPVGGFNAPLTLDIVPGTLPPGVQPGFSPDPMPANGQSTYTLTVGSTAPLGSNTLTVIATGGGITHQYPLVLTVTPGNLAVTLAPSPSSGNAPLATTLTATVSGSAQGTINYNFWWNCAYNGTNLAAAIAACGNPSVSSNGAKFDSVVATTEPAPHVYASQGTYRAFVLVERETSAASAAATVTARAQVITHAECVNSACVQVAGSGANRCGSASDCGGGGGGGGGGPVFGQCDAVQHACVNRAGSQASSCAIDPACGGTGGDSHLACENAKCVIVGGPGVNENGCVAIGATCSDAPPVGPGNCSIKASPAIIKKGDTSTVSWSCSAGVSGCALSGANIVSQNGSTASVKPIKTTQYSLACRGLSSNLPVSVYVVQSLDETNPGN